MALATEWVARIFAISLVMFLPGLAGQWLDERFGTRFLALVGFGFGFCAGLGGLLAMVNNKPASGVASEETTRRDDDDNRGSNERGER